MDNLTTAFLHESLYYDPHSGSFTWKIRPLHHFKNELGQSIWNAKFSLQPAGSLDKAGYHRIKIDGALVAAHRIAWKMFHGEFPEQEIDHINGDRTDNRIANLRTVSPTDNRRNAKRRTDNNSGVVGVHLQSRHGTWTAKIHNQGSYDYLGSFRDFFEAVCARKSAEVRYGYHENHGRR